MGFAPSSAARISTPLQLEWERRLRRAGEHRPEIRLLVESEGRDGLVVVSDQCRIGIVRSQRDNDDGGEDVWMDAANIHVHGEPTPLSDTPTARYWARFAQAVHDLPANYRGRRFLLAYSDSGCLLRARMAGGLSDRQAQRTLASFIALWRSQRC